MAGPDLSKAHEALQKLKSNPAALDRFAVALDTLRRDTGVTLDDATAHYVANALVNQREVDGHSSVEHVHGVAKLAHGFRIKASIE